MTKKTWIIFAAICAVIIGGLIYMSNGNKVDVDSINTSEIQQATDKNGQIADHVYGNAKSKVIIFEYGDYQCPGCGRAHPVLRQISEKYKKEIGFVFRNYPLYSMHPNAFAAATVAELAGQQGKFWEVHDKLYETQNEWNQLSGTDRTDYFVRLVGEQGVDAEKLRAELTANKQVKAKIDFDTALGKKDGVTGTPSIYINGKKYSDTRYKGNKIDNDPNNAYVWSDAAAFENLVIKPLLKENGISIEE